jgi:hypothetical protein
MRLWMPFFFGQLDMTLMQFPETGPEVAAGGIFKFAKNARIGVISARRTTSRPA